MFVHIVYGTDNLTEEQGVMGVYRYEKAAKDKRDLLKKVRPKNSYHVVTHLVVEAKRLL